MNLQEYEVICNKCDGEGAIHSDDPQGASVTCPKCDGEGKVDWVSNAMEGVLSFNKLHGTFTSINPCADINFQVEGKELLRITKDAFYIKGRKVVNDDKIYNAFVDFFKQTGTYI